MLVPHILSSHCLPQQRHLKGDNGADWERTPNCSLQWAEPPRSGILALHPNARRFRPSAPRSAVRYSLPSPRGGRNPAVPLRRGERGALAAAGSPPALTYRGHGSGRWAGAASVRSAPVRSVSAPARRRSPASSRLPTPRPRMWRSGRSGTLLLTLRGRRGRRRGAAGGSRPGKWPRWDCPSPQLTVRPGLRAERDRAGLRCGRPRSSGVPRGRLLSRAAQQSAAQAPSSSGSEALVGAGTCRGKAVPKSVWGGPGGVALQARLQRGAGRGGPPSDGEEGALPGAGRRGRAGGGGGGGGRAGKRADFSRSLEIAVAVARRNWNWGKRSGRGMCRCIRKLKCVASGTGWL